MFSVVFSSSTVIITVELLGGPYSISTIWIIIIILVFSFNSFLYFFLCQMLRYSFYDHSCVIHLLEPSCSFPQILFEIHVYFNVCFFDITYSVHFSFFSVQHVGVSYFLCFVVGSSSFCLLLLLLLLLLSGTLTLSSFFFVFCPFCRIYLSACFHLLSHCHQLLGLFKKKQFFDPFMLLIIVYLLKYNRL